MVNVSLTVVDGSCDAEVTESSGGIFLAVQAISVDPAFGTDELVVMIAITGFTAGITTVHSHVL